MPRLLSAAVLIPPLLLWLFFAPAWLFTLIVALAAAVAASELVLASAAERSRLALALVAPASFAYVWSFTEAWHGTLPAILALFVSLLLTLHMGLGGRGRRTFDELALSCFAVLYVGGLLGYLVPLHAAPLGVRLVLLLFACVWIGDTLAFVGGKAWGRRALAPRLSPRKTVEGAMAGLAGSLLAAFLGKLTGAVPLPWGVLLSLAAVMGLAGQLGDLMESLVKRCFGVKDAGGLLPGHGGLLDRIDGLLLAAPASYFWLKFLERFLGM